MKKYQYMLKNAGEIQYWSKILYDEEEEHKLVFNPSDREEVILPRHNRKGEVIFVKIMDYCPKGWYVDTLPIHRCEKAKVPDYVAKFIIKNRSLRSGLSNPMARYLAWKWINKS